jgi:hypothetical protein
LSTTLSGLDAQVEAVAAAGAAFAGERDAETTFIGVLVYATSRSDRTPNTGS